jgi:hypothetical protein
MMNTNQKVTNLLVATDNPQRVDRIMADWRGALLKDANGYLLHESYYVLQVGGDPKVAEIVLEKYHYAVVIGRLPKNVTP